MMKVVYMQIDWDSEKAEHITLENVWKIENIGGGRLAVHYLEDGVYRKGLKIPKEYIMSIIPD